MGYSAFQRASINKICNHFVNHSRVICADEAGLGKTYIARGVIEHLADEKLRRVLKSGNSIQDCETWWSNFIKQSFGFKGNGKINAKERVKIFGKAVTGDEHWDLVAGEYFTKAMRRIVDVEEERYKNLPLSEKEELWFHIMKNLPNLIVAYNKTKSNLERKEGWDFKLEDFPNALFPAALKDGSFRVLYICSNLAIAEQNTSRLIDCRQRSIQRDHKPDRLSIVWYYKENYYTPYVELYPVSYTLAKSDTQGTQIERKLLGELCRVDLTGVKLADNPKGIECRKKGEEESLKIAYDLIIFDEFQNFGDAIALINHNKKSQNSLYNVIPSNVEEKAEIQEKKKLFEICKALYPEKVPSQKTLLLSATPFKDLETSKDAFGHISLGDILSLLGGNITDYRKCLRAKDKADYLYNIGIFRNERKNMISSYTPLILQVPCSSQGVLTQAALIKGEGQGNKGLQLVKYVPEAVTFVGETKYTGLSLRQYDNISTSFGYDFDRLKKCKNIIFSPKAIDDEMQDSCDFSGEDLAQLLWIPPTKPSHSLGGVFERYADFSKSFIFTDELDAIPTKLTDIFNSEVSYSGCTFEDKDALKKKLQEKYFVDFTEATTEAFVEMVASCGGKAFSTNPVPTDEVLRYCEQGCLGDVLSEFCYLYGMASDDSLKKIFLFMKSNNYPFAMKLDGVAISAEDKSPTMRRNFNSPFMPFVLSTTSIGTEGMDFHLYCDRLIHYCLPKSFIDWEQKNGRIDRRDSLAVRRWWAKSENLWQLLEREKIEKASGGLSPHWDSGNGGLHYYYLYMKDSEEEQRFNSLRSLVRENRMVLGSDGISLQIDDGELINLSPYLREKKS